MKYQSAILSELDNTIDDLEDFLKPKVASHQVDLESSLDDLENYIHPTKASSNIAKPKLAPNRIDRVLKQQQEEVKQTRLQSHNIELSDFEDVDISFIGFPDFQR